MSESLIPVGLVVEPLPVPAGQSSADVAFLQQASQANLTEIIAAKTAVTRATSLATKEFAEWMIADHTQAEGAVGYLASELKISLPTTLTAQQQAELNMLASTPEQGFDTAYALTQFQDHIGAVNLFTQEAVGGQNPAIAAFARQLLPVLTQHFNASESLVTNATGVHLNPAPVGSAPMLPVGAPLGTPNGQDTSFVQAAAQSNMLEVAEGKLVQTAANPAADQFGAWMVTDHTAAEAALQNIAAQEGVAVPTSLDSAHQQELNTLTSLSDGGFFQTYVTDQIVGHAQALMTFLHETEAGQDVAFRAYAGAALPLLVQHLQGALELQQAVPGAGVASAATIDANLAALVGTVAASGNSSLTQYVNNVVALQPGFSAFQRLTGFDDPAPAVFGSMAHG